MLHTITATKELYRTGVSNIAPFLVNYDAELFWVTQDVLSLKIADVLNYK